MKLKTLVLSIALLSTLFLFSINSAYATHDDIVVGGVETTGLARGPAIQVFDKQTGALRGSRFVLNNTFGTEFKIVQNVRNGGANHERILICGRSVTLGPAFQLFERDADLTWLGYTKFALNPSFSQLSCAVRDLDGDGIDEIIVVGNDPTTGFGWIAQTFTQETGALIGTLFLLNNDFRNSDVLIGSGPDDTGN